MVENMTAINPMASMPGFDAMRAQQEAFFKAMTGGMGQTWSGPSHDDSEEVAAPTDSSAEDELNDIKKQLAELQSKLSKM